MVEAKLYRALCHVRFLEMDPDQARDAQSDPRPASGVKSRARRSDDGRDGAGALGLETGVGSDGGKIAVPGVGAVDLAGPGRLDPVLQLDVVGVDETELPVLHDRGREFGVAAQEHALRLGQTGDALFAHDLA